MRRVGTEIFVQQGETWSLDFKVKSKKGHPFMILNKWKNPYLVITISSTLYDQSDVHKDVYWLDLDTRLVEKSDGKYIEEKIKKFVITEPLYVDQFNINEILSKYGTKAGGKIVLDKANEFDITNFLFYTDPYSDGNYVYKYLKSYVTSSNPTGTWVDYDFRVVKFFDTKAWKSQDYFYDIKIVAGESLVDFVRNSLKEQGTEFDEGVWTDLELCNYINLLEDDVIREEAKKMFDENVPLRSSYDAKVVLLDPSRLHVTTNI